MPVEKCKTRTNYISKLRSNIKEEQHIERTKVKTNVHFCIDIYVRRWKQNAFGHNIDEKNKKIFLKNIHYILVLEITPHVHYPDIHNHLTLNEHF